MHESGIKWYFSQQHISLAPAFGPDFFCDRTIQIALVDDHSHWNVEMAAKRCDARQIVLP
jgi:hypothetical protein